MICKTYTITLIALYFLSSVHRFRPDVSVEYVQSTLAFPCLDSCRAFLTGLGVTFTPSDPLKIDCKTSTTALAAS